MIMQPSERKQDPLCIFVHNVRGFETAKRKKKNLMADEQNQYNICRGGWERTYTRRHWTQQEKLTMSKKRHGVRQK